jgi:serine/threonine protein kinase
MKNDAYIADMGLCGEVGNLDKTEIYGVMPYVAPEVLRSKPYTQAADIYSFGMIMYFIATGKQPFGDCAHDHHLVLDICNGIKPEISEQEAPKCYIDLMKRCWDSNPDNRPSATEIYELVSSFCMICIGIKDTRPSNRDPPDIYTTPNKLYEDYEIKDQFKKAEEYRKSHASFSKENIQPTVHTQAVSFSKENIQPTVHTQAISFSKENIQPTVHTQAIYISRLLNPFTKNISIHNDSLELGDLLKLVGLLNCHV